MTIDNAAMDDIKTEGLKIDDCHQLGSYTMTLADIISFAKQWDPQLPHTDPKRTMSADGNIGITASSTHILAIFARLSVLGFLHHLKVLGGAGIHDLQFTHPVRPGDTLTGCITVKDIIHEPQRSRILATYQGELLNQHAELVMIMSSSVYLQT